MISSAANPPTTKAARAMSRVVNSPPAMPEMTMLQAINDALNSAFGQRQVSTIYAQANQYRVVLEAMPQYQRDPSALSKLYLPSSTGAFRRAIPLPAAVDADRVTAEYDKGVLVVHLPRTAESRPRRIQVRPAGN